MMGSELLGPFIALAAGMMIFFVVLMIAAYIYYGLAYSAIAKKAKLKTPGLAWIPGVGPLIIAFQAAKMPWWPWLLLIGLFIPYISFLFAIAFCVFAIIWHWKMFEKIRRPGWWAILMLVGIVREVLIGIAAWSKK